MGEAAQHLAATARHRRDLLLPVVRPALSDDAPRLAHLMRDCFMDVYADGSAPANVAAYLDAAFGESHQASELADAGRRIWTAEHDDRWLGFAQLRMPSMPPAGVDLARPAQLHRIYLPRAAAGTGLGRRLLDTVRDAARALGADRLWLSAWQRTPGPIGFYERQGFRAVGTAEFPVGHDPLVDWIMQAPLAAA